MGGGGALATQSELECRGSFRDAYSSRYSVKGVGLLAFIVADAIAPSHLPRTTKASVSAAQGAALQPTLIPAVIYRAREKNASERCFGSGMGTRCAHSACRRRRMRDTPPRNEPRNSARPKCSRGDSARRTAASLERVLGPAGIPTALSSMPTASYSVYSAPQRSRQRALFNSFCCTGCRAAYTCARTLAPASCRHAAACLLCNWRG